MTTLMQTVVIPSFSKVGTLISAGASRAAYNRANLNERVNMSRVDGAEVMALTFYEGPRLVPGSNEGEVRLVGWDNEVCLSCDNSNVLGVLSTQIGEKTIIGTVHTCAYLKGVGYRRQFQAWGSIKIDPPIRETTQLQSEALEVFRKIQSVVLARPNNEGLWQVVVDDLTRLLMTVRTATGHLRSAEPSPEREGEPHMALVDTSDGSWHVWDWMRNALGRVGLDLNDTTQLSAILTGTLTSVVLGAASVIRSRVAVPQMEYIPGVRTLRHLQETIDTAPTALAAVTNSAEELQRVGFNMNQILASVQQWTNAPAGQLVSSDLFCLFLDLIRECLQTHPLGLTTLAIRFCKTFNVFEREGDVVSLFTKLWTYYTTTPVTQLDQTGMDERIANPNGVGEILAALVALIGLGVCRGAYTDKAANRVTEALRAINVCVPAGRNLASLMSGVASVLPPAVGAWFEELCPEQLWLQALKEEDVEEWMNATEKLCIESNKLLLVHDAEMQYQLSCLKKRGEVISAKLSCLARCAPGMYNRILRRLELVDEFVRHLACVSGLVDNKRPVPFCVYLYGDAGIGKSVASEVIVEALVPKEIPQRMRVYSRVPGSDYFDGYLCQWAVVMDDYAQSADGEDALELIRMVNSANYMPPMASLDNASIGVKATPFTSRLLVLTSNTGYPSSNKITKQQAAWRRRHYLLECKVKDEYATGGMLDFSKVPRDVAARLGHIQWIRRDATNPRACAKEMTTVEMLLDLRAAYRQHAERNDFLMQGGLFKGLLDEVVAQERSAQPNMEVDLSSGCHRRRVCVKSSDALVSAVQEMREDSSEPVDIDFVSAQEETTFDRSTENAEIMDTQAWRELFRQPLVRKGMQYISTGRQSVAEGYACLRTGVETFMREHPWIASCLAASGVVAAVFGAVAFAWGLSDTRAITPNMANPSPGDQKHETTGVRFAKRVATRARDGKANMETMQGFSPYPHDAEGPKIVDLLSKNMVYMRVHNPVDDSAFGMGGFVLRGRTVILPMHFFKPHGELVEDGRQMSVLWGGKETKFLFLRRNLHSFVKTDEHGRERDLAFYELPTTVAPFRDRSSMVVDDSYLERMHRKQGYLLSMRSGRLSVTMLPDLKVSQITTTYAIGNTRFATPVTLEYTAPTQVGDCGALVLVADPSMQARIVGIHIASCKSLGIADFLTSVELGELDLVSPAQGERGPVVPNFCVEGEPGRFAPKGDFTILGRASRSTAVRMADSSHIRESVIHDLAFEHETEPAVLRPDDPRLREDLRGKSVILRAIEKYGHPSGPFDELTLDETVDFYTDMICGPDTPYPRRVLTLDEAINGIPGLKYMDGLCMQSSAGFGFRKPGCPGKLHLFDQREDGTYCLKGDGLGRQLTLSLAHREAEARCGNRVCSVWTDSLKDERRPMAKIADGKTRAFCIPPVDYSLLVRKYFLAFCGHFYSLHKSSFSAVGCDPESSDWNIFARQLLGVSDKLFDADFENFDGRAAAEVMRRVLDLVNRFYDDGPENARVREVLIEEMIHTVAICGDTLYVKHGGMPSGSPLTVVFNTLINMFYMHYCYLHLVPAPLANNAVFQRCLAFKIYGDDNVAAVASGMLPYFNAKRVADVLLEHGIVITPASKAGDFADSMSISEITFLKRAFAIQPDVNRTLFVPQMAKRTITELTNWIHDNGDPMEMTKVNCETALRFAMFHGREFFNEMREKILAAFRRVTPEAVLLPSFGQLVRNFNEMHCGQSTPPSNSEILLARAELGEREAEPQMERLGAPLNPLAPEVLRMQGVDIVTQTGVVEDGYKVEKELTQRVEKDSIMELPWSIKTIAERENFLGNYAWDVTSDYGTPLLSTAVPSASFPDSPLLRIMRQFTYYRGDWVFTFQLNGSRFHQGALICYSTPLVDRVSSAMLLSRVHATAMRHVMLSASSSTTAQLRIPFIHPKTYLPTSPTERADSLATLMVQVMNGLDAATGSPTQVWVSVSYHVENLQVYLPRTVGVSVESAERVAVPNMEIVADAPTARQEEGKVPNIGPEQTVPHDMVGKDDRHYHSLRDLIKRKYPLSELEITAASVSPEGTAVVLLDVSNAWNRLWPTSRFNDILGLYGMIHGSIRFTIAVQNIGSVGQDLALEVAYLPFVPTNNFGVSSGPQFTSTYNPLRLLPFTSALPAVLGNYVRMGVCGSSMLPVRGYYRTPGGTVNAIELKSGMFNPGSNSGADAPYFNVEVPFQSIYSAYMNLSTTFTTADVSGSTLAFTDACDFAGRLTPGTLAIVVRGLAATQAARLQVWVSAGDAMRAGVFHAVPKLYVNSTTLPKTGGSYSFPTTADRRAVRNNTFLASERVATAQGNQVSVWKISQKFGNVATATLPMNVSGDKFDTKQQAHASFPIGGMDKPSWTLNPDPVWRIGLPYMSHAQNIEPVDVLDLHPATLEEATPHTFGTSEDEMSIEYLAKKMTYMTRFTWDTSAAADALLFATPVGMLTGCRTAVGESNDAPLVDILSVPFARFSGNVRYRFQFVCTGFHTGRIWVGVTYNPTFPLVGAVPSTIEQAVNQYGRMIDLGGQVQDITFDVPFKAPARWCPVNNTSTGADSAFSSCYGVAVLSVWVVNKLVAPDGVPTSIKVNVYKGAGENFQLHTLGGTNSDVVWAFADDPAYGGAVELGRADDTTSGDVEASSAVTSKILGMKLSNNLGFNL